MWHKIILSKKDIQKLATDEPIVIPYSGGKLYIESEECHKKYQKEIKDKKPIFKDNLPENWQ